jgi:cohesin complex subunit SCC1
LIFSDVDIEAQFSINQSRADEITMREDYGSLPMNMHDDGFGEIGFDGPDLRDGLNPTIDASLIEDFF